MKILTVIATISAAITAYKRVKDMFYENTDFPYEEIRRADGNYFDSVEEALTIAKDEYNIWSVIDDEIEVDNKRYVVFTYGPSRHYVNVIGFVVTKEAHNGNTYFEEYLEMYD